MIHTMVDIETLGKSSRALIWSLGAVKFNADEILDRFHVGIDPVDAQRYGLELDADTIMWWMHPDRDAARKQQLELGRVDLFAALDGFDIWTKSTPEDERGSCWGNGATFDNVLLKNAYAAARLDYPFSYKQDECYRTMRNRAPDVEFERIGTHHDGLADAESQAVHLQKICKHLRIAL